MITYKCDICCNEVSDKTKLYFVAEDFRTKDFQHVCLTCHRKLEEEMKPIKKKSQEVLVRAHRTTVQFLRSQLKR